MRLNSVNPIVVLIVTGMMVIPGAVVGTPAVVQDQLFPEQPPDITVEPAPGAEQYVTNTTQTANGNTNISIEVANPGVNADAITEFQELLVITHTDNANAGSVTVTVEQQDPRLTVGRDLTFTEPDNGVGATGSNFTLTPGESETLGLEVNTMGVDIGNTLTLNTTLTIKTRVAETGPISRPPDPIPPTLITDSGPPAAEATVEIDTGADTDVQAGEVPVSQSVDLKATGSNISSLSSLVEGQVDTPTENPAVIDGPFNLSAGDSAVTPEGAVEFEVTEPNETAPNDIRVIHSPDGENWKFLETTVTDEDQAQADTLVLEATPETDSFGTFAVVDDSNVRFEWSGDLPEDRGSGDSVSDVDSLGTPSTIGAGAGVGVGVPTASILISTENSDLIERLETAAGIAEQVENNRPTGFTLENVIFDEPGSKQINVTLIDADGRQSVGTTTIDVIDPSSGGDSGSEPDGTEEQQQQEEEPQTPTEEQKQQQQQQPAPDAEGTQLEVEVESESEGQSSEQTVVDVEPVSREALPEGETEPTAVIDPQSVETSSDGGETGTESETEVGNGIGAGELSGDISELEASRDRIVTEPNEEVELGGTRSTVGSTEAVASSQQVSETVDINPQPRSDQGSDESTLTLRADRSTFEGQQIDPDDAAIGRLTDDGWQLLKTDVDIRGDSVVLEATTPGFSPFAIFADTDVSYSWTLPDGSTATGRNIQEEFTEPGIYEVELTVRNSLGQTDTTTQTIVVNDIPAIEDIATARTGANETTLTANLSNEVGNVSVRWEFPDGTIKTGQTVTTTTQKTEYVVSVSAEDEYGASAESEQRVVTPPQETILDQGAVPQQMVIPAMLSLMGIVGSVVGYRTVPWKGILSRLQRNPRIVELGEPFCNHETHCLGVGSLVAEDNSRPITHVDLTVVRGDGTRLITKAMKVESTTVVGKHQYSSDSATIQIPPSVSLNGTATYQVEVEIANQKGKTATEQTPEFTCSFG